MQAESRAWEMVLAFIEKRLANGTSRAGDHLPPERVLATELGVARSSVREAIRVLEVMGLVRTQSGSGPKSGAILLPQPAGGIELLMRLHVAAHGFAIPDVVRTRILLETAVVDDLARRPDQVSLAHAIQLLHAMDAPQSRESFLACDAAFHLALADASGNTVIAATMTGLRSSIEHYVLAGGLGLPEWDLMAARLRAEHRDIISSIAAGDAPAARTRIRTHIGGYYKDAFPIDLDASSNLHLETL